MMQRLEFELRDLHARRSRIVVVVATYIVLALMMTWPVPLSPSSRLPVGTGSAATVPLFNTWTIWWNADRLAHGLKGYWDAPIFHPEPGTFALSEPQPVTWMVAPIVWCGFHILAYNVYLWLSLLLNGLSAFALFRGLRLRWSACFVGGALAETLPFVQWQIGVLQLVPLYGVFWTLSGIRATSLSPTVPRGVLLGLAFALTYLTCSYTGLFLSVLLFGCAVWYPGLWLRRSGIWTALLIAFVTGTLVISPVVFRQTSALNQRHGPGTNEYARTRVQQQRLSLHLGDYTVTPASWCSFPGDLAADERRPYWTACPGWLKFGVAIAGACFGLSRRRWRRWTAFSVTLLTFAVLLSLGPDLLILGWHPSSLVFNFWPGFSHVRNVFRFAIFAQVGVILLATLGCHAAFVAVKLLRKKLPGSSHLFMYPAVMLGPILVFEVPPCGSAVYDIADPSAHDGWVKAVRDAEPGRSVVCFPFAAGNSVRDFELTTLWMYGAMFHGRPLVNGYSGYFPQRYRSLRDVVSESFLSEKACRILKECNVGQCVVARSFRTREQVERIASGEWKLEWFFGDDIAGVDVYTIHNREDFVHHADAAAK
jgi:hypothetical protein